MIALLILQLMMIALLILQLIAITSNNRRRVECLSSHLHKGALQIPLQINWFSAAKGSWSHPISRDLLVLGLVTWGGV